jgi:multiple sugar transport system ATP-binding protein
MSAADLRESWLHLRVTSLTTPRRFDNSRINKIKRRVPLASLELNNISKAYGDTLVLDDVSLAMEAREFVAFLGPSGSGKSTLLRIIAGLETPDAGEVLLEGRRIDPLPPGERDVAMVFQHYALYPHMTVRENMAFGLRNARVAKDEIDQRIADAARILEIESQLEKKPAQMSGGQRQRVAIGRAIVKHPKIFLLDEPLSNLDAALRTRTRVELAQLRQRVDAAVIMVTHDQAEAMTLADRIVVMNDRRIQQVGAPMEVYTRPANAFVARFVGSPAMTLAAATLVGDGEHARVRLGSGAEVDTRVRREGLPASGPLKLGLRPEAVTVVAEGAGTIDAKVELVERLGDRTLVYARVSDGLEVTAQDEGNSGVRIGDRVGLRIDGNSVHLFDADGAGHHALADG